MGDQSSSSRLQALFAVALRDYESTTNITLAKHPLAKKLENCHSVQSTTALLQDQVKEFRGRDKIMRSIGSTVSFLNQLSTISFLSVVISPVFPPVTAIQAGLGILLAAANGVVDSHNALVDLLESIEHFLKRLDIYTKVSPTPAMDEIVVKILVELVSTLALATKELKQGRSKKFVKKLFGGDKDAEAILQRLDRLTQDEARATAAEILNIVHGLVQDMNGKASDATVLEALETLHQMASDMNKSERDKLQKDIQSWLSSPDPWKNHNIALASRHKGTAAWFVQGDTFSQWKSSGLSPLLWIHANPGVGKSVLCSAIIQDIFAIKSRGLASLAFFYHDFNEENKRNLRGLLSSMLVQLCHQSEPYCDILSKFYSDHAGGLQHPSDDELIACLKDILKCTDQAPVFLIVDALDECSDISDIPSPREKVLNLLEELIELQVPNLHICVTSRPEADINLVLRPLASYSVSLHGERGQMQDINNYIKSVVKDIRKWKSEHKQLVVDILTKRADGMFRWVHCQLVYLRGCHPSNILDVLAELPETLDQTYERTLQEINKANRELAHRLFQCVAVASRPLRVGELAELLAFDFKAGPIPKFRDGWRLDDPVDAVLSTCPDFLAIIDVGDSQIIQFSHYSVKEFLTSTRLANVQNEISRYHISMTPAHTLIAQACLGILLHPDKDLTEESVRKFALAPYAALHWVDHARSEDASQYLEDGINDLFDPSKPYLTIWVSLYNTELPSWKLLKRGERPVPTSGTPLHYATACGLHAFVKILLIGHKYDVNSRGMDNLTPLHIASMRGHEAVARTLLDGGADVAAQNEDGRTPLHIASLEGHFQVVRVLLEHSAPTTAKDKDGLSPLHLALQTQLGEVPDVLLDHDGDENAKDEDEHGRVPLHSRTQIDFLSYLISEGASFQVARELLQRGVDSTVQDEDGVTQLHLAMHHERIGAASLIPEHEADATPEDKDVWNHVALRKGHVEVVRCLVEHGADATAEDKDGSTPLYWACLKGHVEVAQFLIEHGADATAKRNDRRTPLYGASQGGHVEVVRFLIKHGADVTHQDENGRAPLHVASELGHVEVVQLLVEYGADVMARNKHQGTPLHRASFNGHVGVARILVQHGADVSAQNDIGWIPLHSASKNGHQEVAQFLVDKGADVTHQDKDGQTPLHVASEFGYLEVVQLLTEHGANVISRNKYQWTPLHVASFNGHVSVARFLVQHGADVSAQNDIGWLPLHAALQSGHVEVAQFLIDQGTDVTHKDKDGWTPLHVASELGQVEVVQLLVKHGADVTARNKYQGTPLHRASYNGHVGVARLLVQLGADASAQNNIGWMPLHTALHRGHMEVARSLVDHGADVTHQDKDGQTPLHVASELGYAEVVQLLIEHGADVTARNKYQGTPLHRASFNGHVTVARLLVRHGADASAQNDIRWIPLHTASQRGHVQVAQFLVDQGADVTHQDKDGQTPLHVASEFGHVGVVQLLVERGADVTARNKYQGTPLHRASFNGHVTVARLLVQHGADVSAQNNIGRIPLHSASQGGHVEVVQFLVDQGADVTHQDKDGKTPLHVASGHVKVARLLVKRGADVTARNN